MMHFLLLNQTFHPDVASTAQHLTDLALGLVEQGHQVTVLTSRRAYDDPTKQFPKNETWRGICIHRISSTGFGKGAKWRRALDFGSFLALCLWRLLLLPRHDAVVALTSPPLISFLGAWVSRLRRSRFFYWVMDFNPDEAIAAGWLAPHSVPARILESMSRFSLNQAEIIIALDRFMRDRIVAKSIPPDKVVVLPPWSHDNEVRFDPQGRDAFRQKHGLQGKFVVMYSGNHSPCHPLDTLLRAADELAGNNDIAFCFVGGGSEFRKIQERVARADANGNPTAPRPRILCLPYQPLSSLAGSLSAADLHVVVMGNPFVGLIHPCKIYNILAVAAPVLYIGPQTSHLSEIATAVNCELPFFLATHGNVEQVVVAIQQSRRAAFDGGARPAAPSILSSFSKHTLLPRLISELESV